MKVDALISGHISQRCPLIREMFNFSFSYFFFIFFFRKTQTDDQDISLFTAAEEIFAIERTVSRLTEMQSEQYWEGSKQNDE